MRGSVVISVSTGSAEVDLAADDAAEDVPLGQDTLQSALRIADEHRIADAGALDGADALSKGGARLDGQRLPPGQDAEALLEHRGDAATTAASVSSVTTRV